MVSGFLAIWFSGYLVFWLIKRVQSAGKGVCNLPVKVCAISR
jgi:hypothetical protein